MPTPPVSDIPEVLGLDKELHSISVSTQLLSPTLSCLPVQQYTHMHTHTHTQSLKLPLLKSFQWIRHFPLRPCKAHTS